MIGRYTIGAVLLVVPGGFEPPSPAPKAGRIDHYPTGLFLLRLLTCIILFIFSSIVLTPRFTTLRASEEACLALISASKLSQPPVCSVVAAFFAFHVRCWEACVFCALQYRDSSLFVFCCCGKVLTVPGHLSPASSTLEEIAYWKHHALTSWAELHISL